MICGVDKMMRMVGAWLWCGSGSGFGQKCELGQSMRGF